jgi:hypothetical protein
MNTHPPTGWTHPRRRRGRARWAVVAVSGVAVLASIAQMAAAQGQNGGWNYQTSGQCVWMQSWVGSSPAMAGTTHSIHGGCIGMSVPGPPAYAWGRQIGYIGVRPHLWRNGSLCTAPAWQSNPSYGATTHVWSISWGSAPCGSGTFFNRTAGRVKDTSAIDRPNSGGTPTVQSPSVGW